MRFAFRALNHYCPPFLIILPFLFFLGFLAVQRPSFSRFSSALILFVIRTHYSYALDDTYHKLYDNLMTQKLFWLIFLCRIYKRFFFSYFSVHTPLSITFFSISTIPVSRFSGEVFVPFGLGLGQIGQPAHNSQTDHCT